jgi:hypothetical protein
MGYWLALYLVSLNYVGLTLFFSDIAPTDNVFISEISDKEFKYNEMENATDGSFITF